VINNGQSCIAAKRHHRGVVVDEFEHKFVAAMQAIVAAGRYIAYVV